LTFTFGFILEDGEIMTLPTEQLLPWYEVYPVLSMILLMIVLWSAAFTWATASDGAIWWVKLKQYITQCVSRG